jgi:spore germination protein YaaH
VTLDFEGLKGADLKAGYNAFLIALSGRLKSLHKRLYVAVQPATEGNISTALTTVPSASGRKGDSDGP